MRRVYRPTRSATIPSYTIPLRDLEVFPWLRLIRVGFSVVGTPRIGVFDTTRVRMHTWPNDLDLNLHVNNGRYLALADIARLHWFLRSNAIHIARRERAVPIVGDAIAKFRRDLKVFQRFEIQTRLLGWDHRWGFLEHRFVREGRVLGVVGVRGVFKGPSGPIDPQFLLAAVGAQSESPPLPQWIIEWNSSCESLSKLLRSEETDRVVP
jgi:acyl-CoA thioesterase FadM